MTSWQAPAPPTTSDDGEVCAADPRVIQNHAVGQLPCPSNPSPPSGWAYWKGSVSKFGVDLCVRMQKNTAQYPMGSFVQTIDNGHLIGARVEWHPVLGSNGKRGCFRGVNLMRKP